MADIQYVTNILTGTGTVEERLDALETQVNLNTLAIESIVNTLQSLITSTQFTQLTDTVDDVQTLVTTLETTVNGIVTNGVAARLSELKDVEITNLLVNDVITYNGTKFVNTPIADVSGVGNWNTILNKPATFPSDWNTMINRPASASVTWSTLSGKPTYFPTAWDGGYITGKPSVFPPAAHEHDATYVKKVGDTMTGPLVINYTTGNAITVNGVSVFNGSECTLTVNNTYVSSTKSIISSQDIVAYQADAVIPGDPIATPIVKLSQLEDVQLSDVITTGKGLVFDGTYWRDTTIAATGGTADSISWANILYKPTHFPTTWDLISGTAPTVFDSRYILKAGDTVPGLITFNAGITVNNGITIFKVASGGLVEVTGMLKATSDVFAYNI